MGQEKADFIKEMWAQYYADSLSDNTKAGDFQLAIWGVLMGTASAGQVTSDFTWLTSGSSSGAQDIIDWANNNTGDLADVAGLNPVSAGPQSYAIPGVPDGGFTAVLLGMGMLALGGVRRMVK